jgi:bifunctional UDP-N-acetylglucosamine pyrophosphorylase/glucosamine-1-phosphate N-acetyltransferase
VIEKPENFVWNLANMAAYKFNGSIIQMCKEVQISSRWEYEITDALNSFIQENKFQLHTISDDLLDIGYAWNLLDANTLFLGKLSQSDIRGKIEENVTIRWNIILEEWAIIKSGSYIEWNCYFWKDSVIWPNAYIRGNTSLWQAWKIWFSVEVKNSYIWDNTKIPHLSYVWDSVIWNNVNLWWGFKVANLRHDKKNIRVMIKWNLVDSWKYKLGCIIGDNVKTWINTLIYPGRVLETGSGTNPWEIIK